MQLPQGYFLNTPYDPSQLVSLLKPGMRSHLLHPTAHPFQPQLLQYQLGVRQMRQMPSQLALQSRRLDVIGENQLNLDINEYLHKF